MKVNRLKIEIACAEQKISQKTLAQRCGMNIGTINDVINRGTGSTVTVGRIAEALGVPVADIVEE